MGTLIAGIATFIQAPLLQCTTPTSAGCAATLPVTQSPAAALPLACDANTGTGT